MCMQGLSSPLSSPAVISERAVTEEALQHSFTNMNESSGPGGGGGCLLKGSGVDT